MKFFHLSDLHLGKRVNEFSMLEDQWHILQKIVVFAKEHKPDAVLIAGDVYDKSMPIVEAVQLLDRFLVWLNELGITVFIVSGNHDNAERVAFGAELLKNSSVHIVQSYNGKIAPVTLSDGYGDIKIWMLPYLKPSLVRRHFPDKDVVTYSDAISAALSNANLDASTRNVLIAHQFVTGAITSDSEEIYVGGSENVDSSIFDGFDYVALGHIPLYTEKDTWARIMPDGTVKIGITDYAQQMLKEINFVELPEAGDKVVQMESFGNAESTKAVSPIICPISGVVKEVNEEVADEPGIINQSPFDSGWLIIVEPSDLENEKKNLLDSAAYTALIHERA